MPRTVDELKTWRVATFVLAILAVVVFCVQRFVAQIFDVAFEICMFYVPALTVIVYAFHLYRKQRLLE